LHPAVAGKIIDDSRPGLTDGELLVKIRAATLFTIRRWPRSAAGSGLKSTSGRGRNPWTDRWTCPS